MHGTLKKHGHVELLCENKQYSCLVSCDSSYFCVLSGDIGGSMGLFVGASVITVFELCDAIIHNFLKMQIEKNRRRKRAAGIAKRQNGKV